MRRLPLVAIAVVTLLACTSDDGASSPSAGCIDAQGGRITLVAQGRRWNADCLRAPAGALTIGVDNRDVGDNHNLHLPNAPESPATELVLGPSTTRLDVTLMPGGYEFICDIHPNMVGTLTVDPAN